MHLLHWYDRSDIRFYMNLAGLVFVHRTDEFPKRLMYAEKSFVQINQKMQPIVRLVTFPIAEQYMMIDVTT